MADSDGTTTPRKPPEYDINDVLLDVSHLWHLLDTIMRVLMEMPYEREGRRDVELDRVAALTSLARDRANGIQSDIQSNFFGSGAKVVRS